MSAELGVAKDELGKGWTLAAGSGVENNEIVRFLRTAAKVAITDGSDIETAIDGMTSVLNAYNYESADAARDRHALQQRRPRQGIVPRTRHSSRRRRPPPPR